MPVTNRGVVQLTPVTTTTSTRNYLNSLPPSLATLQTGLALFAVVIIARFCAVQLHAWFRRLRGADRPSHRRVVILDHSQRSQRPLWAMEEKNHAQDTVGNTGGNDVVYEEEEAIGRKLAIDPNWTSTAINGDSMPRSLVSRPPPAPPLTPPELSTAVFTFEGRPRGSDDSFMHQPNPDYMSSTTTAMTASNSVSSPSIPRRRSYNKTLPIGVPVPISQQSSTLSDTADLTFSPSSYPPTSPLLPPAPPNAGAKEIDVQGQIIGVLDGEGAGWTRHTRVYGGGVCLACAASGGNHGGGFYGATVRPEEMR